MPEEIEVELFIHDANSTPQLVPSIRVHSYESSCFTLIGKTTVMVPIPEISRTELVAKRVDILNQEKQRIRAETNVKINNIDEQINELLALEAPKEEE